MPRYENILVLCDPEDGGGDVLLQARSMAAPGARITIADVLGIEAGAIDRFLSPVPHGNNVEATVITRRRTALYALSSMLRDEGFDTSVRVLHGTRDRAVLEAVDTHRHDLVVLPMRATTWRPVLHGMDQYLIRACPCPVWALGQTSEAGAGHVLAALGPVRGDPVRAELNHDILSQAAALAVRTGAKLDVCHVWSAPELAVLRGHTDLVSEAEQSDLAQQRARRSRARLECFASALPKPHPPLRMLHLEGTPEDILADHVAAEGIDTIVMGTMTSKTPAGPSLGGTAETLLSRVTCSVLALRPRLPRLSLSQTAQDLAS